VKSSHIMAREKEASDRNLPALSVISLSKKDVYEARQIRDGEPPRLSAGPILHQRIDFASLASLASSRVQLSPHCRSAKRQSRKHLQRMPPPNVPATVGLFACHDSSANASDACMFAGHTTLPGFEGRSTIGVLITDGSHGPGADESPTRWNWSGSSSRLAARSTPHAACNGLRQCPAETELFHNRGDAETLQERGHDPDHRPRRPRARII
jgi:hypothetical protein